MEAMIQIKDVTKTFVGKDNQVEALKGINLSIQKGEIYGIIGMSGAGKSTLVRCLNFLERPTSGTVLIEEKDLATLKDSELRSMRTQIAMIFQHFNLLMQRTVLDNICFPLEITKVPRAKAVERAKELLEIVGLSEASPENCILMEDERIVVQQVVARLPEKYRIPVYLFYSAELSIQESAKVLQIPAGTVKSRMNKAKHVLKEELETLGYDR